MNPYRLGWLIITHDTQLFLIIIKKVSKNE